MTTTQAAPHDLDAESALIGAMVLNRDAAAKALDMVLPADFYRPLHGHIFAAMESLYRRGDPITTVAVADELTRFGLPMNDPSELLGMVSSTPGAHGTTNYAEIIVRHAASRRVVVIGQLAQAKVVEKADPYELIDDLQAELAAIDIPVSMDRQESVTLDEVILDAERSAPWVIPGVIRTDWRVVLVAGEGSGKSTLLRQIAACAAQGVHPFRTSQDMQAVRVLLVDLENPAAAIAETGAPLVRLLRQRRGDDYDPDNLRIFRRPAGLDLRSRRDRSELEREIMLQQPQLVVIGPGYKMIHRRDRGRSNESHEEATEPVLLALDDLRIRHKFALMVEHHAPQGSGGSRELRPYGSQRWMAWPEMGRTMRQDGEPWVYKLGFFRGDRLKNDWPTALHRSDRMPPNAREPWPWEGSWNTPVRAHEPPPSLPLPEPPPALESEPPPIEPEELPWDEQPF